jgi:hypothetical protein
MSIGVEALGGTMMWNVSSILAICSRMDTASPTLGANMLVGQPECSEFDVNFDPWTLELQEKLMVASALMYLEIQVEDDR